jgi:transposase
VDVAPTPAPAKPNAKGKQQTQPTNTQAAFQRTDVNATAPAAPAAAEPAPVSEAFANQSSADLNQRAADGFLVNGTANNGASSPFALNQAFGNNRRGARSLYNGNLAVRTFQTTTADLLRLSEWLAINGCTHVAMEATGVYWKPVWHILDDGEFELVLANAAHVKNVPGRKTDVNDAMWLAELLAHGLIRASFVPNAQTQGMRNLLRTRKQLVREQSSHVLRVQKTLEDANIKLDSALTDVMGKSGRAMIEALIAGETNPAKLASLADRRVKASAEKLREALRGRVTKHHRFLLRLHLNQIDALEAAMATIDAQVETKLEPFRTAVELIMSIPGIKNLSAHVIVSEIGIDMSRFPSAAHLISWACICPRNDESAGKRRSNRVRNA